MISREPTAAPVEVAHRSITICHLGNIAMRLNREKLRWDPRTEQIIGDDEASKMLSRPYRSPWTLDRCVNTASATRLAEPHPFADNILNSNHASFFRSTENLTVPPAQIPPTLRRTAG